MKCLSKNIYINIYDEEMKNLVMNIFDNYKKKYAIGVKFYSALTCHMICSFITESLHFSSQIQNATTDQLL